MPFTYPESVREAAIQLRVQENLSTRQIAKRLKVSPQTASKWLVGHPRPNTKGDTCHRCGRDWETVKHFAKGHCKSCYNYIKPWGAEALDDPKLAKRFWSKVDKGAEDECWEWKASINVKGYGQFSWGTGSNRMAHRVAWMLTHQEDPGSDVICHSCDNPSCCNPAHLWRGTHSQNSKDMVRKRRHVVHKLQDQLERAEALLQQCRSSAPEGVKADIELYFSDPARTR